MIESEENAHLFVIIHGLWGSAKNVMTIERLIQDLVEDVSDEKIVTLRPSSFSFWRTYDGIELNSQRVVSEILYEIETLKLKNDYKVVKISFVGYSLGGLIARSTVGILQEMGVFDQIQPIFFTTFATPHLGVQFFKSNPFDFIANNAGKYLFGQTGLELFNHDKNHLLLEMSQPNSKYILGLARFQKHILLANIKNDRSVPFFTSFITQYSPFDDLGMIKIKYIRNLPFATINKIQVRPKFVDLLRSIELNKSEIETFQGNIQEPTSRFRTNKTLRYIIIFTGLIFFIIPIWFPLISTTTTIISIYSFLKIKILSPPDFKKHWITVKNSVYGKLPVDSENAEVGQDNRERTRKLSTSGESFKGSTSRIAENSVGIVMFEEQELTQNSQTVFSDDSGEGSVTENDQLIAEDHHDQTDRLSNIKEQDSQIEHDYSNISKLGKFNLKENDNIAEAIIEYLKNIDESKFPLFNEKSKLKFDSTKKQMLENLNQLNWIKIPVYIDAWNSHDGIVARRGPNTNPKGTAGVSLYCSILRNHLKQST